MNYGNYKFTFFLTDSQEEFDFNSIIRNKEYTLISGIPVNIDRIIRDVTKTTVIGISGTLVIKGVKMRGVWDAYGNIIEFKKMITLLIPNKCNIQHLLCEYDANLFRLVNIETIKK